MNVLLFIIRKYFFSCTVLLYIIHYIYIIYIVYIYNIYSDIFLYLYIILYTIYYSTIYYSVLFFLSISVRKKIQPDVVLAYRLKGLAERIFLIQTKNSTKYIDVKLKLSLPSRMFGISSYSVEVFIKHS